MIATAGNTILSRVTERLSSSDCWRWPAVLAWMAMIYYFSDQPNSNEITQHFFGNLNFWARKLAHMSEYFILFLLNFAALIGPRAVTLKAKDCPERCRPEIEESPCRQEKAARTVSFAHGTVQAGGKSAHLPLPQMIKALLLTILYALSDEWHQSFVKGRSASISDVLIDTTGAVIATSILAYLSKSKKETP